MNSIIYKNYLEMKEWWKGRVNNPNVYVQMIYRTFSRQHQQLFQDTE